MTDDAKQFQIINDEIKKLIKNTPKKGDGSIIRFLKSKKRKSKKLNQSIG